METNSKAAVRGLFLLTSISLSHFCVQELPEIELSPIASTTKERTSLEDRVTETNPKAAVSGFILTILHLSDTLLRTGTA